jgi:hypothetical protein
MCCGEITLVYKMPLSHKGRWEKDFSPSSLMGEEQKSNLKSKTKPPSQLLAFGQYLHPCGRET